MTTTTYTLLVSIAHDDGAAPSTDLLDVMVERALEEGVRDFAGVHAATVTAVRGDRMRLARLDLMQRTADDEHARKAHALHAAMRA